MQPRLSLNGGAPPAQRRPSRMDSLDSNCMLSPSPSMAPSPSPSLTLQRLSVTAAGASQQRRPSCLGSECAQRRPSFLGIDPNPVQNMHGRLSVLSGHSAAAMASRRASRIDVNLSADMGIPIYSSVTDSSDSQEDMEEGIDKSHSHRPARSSLSFASSIGPSLSFSWMGALTHGSISTAWGSFVPGRDDPGVGGEFGPTSPAVIPEEPSSGRASLDFVMRPDDDAVLNTGEAQEAEAGQVTRQPMSRYSRMRLTIFFLLEDPFGSRPAMALSVIFMFAVFAGIALTCLEYHISDCRHYRPSCRLTGFQWVVLVFYTFEVLLRFWCYPRICCFLTYFPNVVDTLNSLELWLILLRSEDALSDWPMLKLVRHFEVALRLLKLCRYSSSWQLLCATLMDSAPALLLPLAAYVILVALGAGLLLVAEKASASSNAPPDYGTEGFSGLYDAVLFCMLCLTSTDTGPFYRLAVKSTAGHVITGLLIVGGHIIFAMPITIVGTCFCRTWFQRDRVLFTKIIRRRLKGQGNEASDTLRQLFDRFANDQTGTLGFDEFQRFVAAIIPSPGTDKVLTLFSTFDQDQDGYIGFEELYATIFPESDPDLWGVLTGDHDAAPNDEVEHLEPLSEAVDAPKTNEDRLGEICKTLESFERKLLDMLEQRLRFAERDHQALGGTPPWVTPGSGSSFRASWRPLLQSPSISSVRPGPSRSSASRSSSSGGHLWSNPGSDRSASFRSDVPTLQHDESGPGLQASSGDETELESRSRCIGPAVIKILNSFGQEQSRSTQQSQVGCTTAVEGLDESSDSVCRSRAAWSGASLRVGDEAPDCELERSHSFPMMIPSVIHESEPERPGEADEVENTDSDSEHASPTIASKALLKLPGDRTPMRSHSVPEVRRGRSPKSTHSPRSSIPSSRENSQPPSRENSRPPSRENSIVPSLGPSRDNSICSRGGTSLAQDGSSPSARPRLHRQLTLTRIRNRASLEEDDDLTPALQPTLSGQWRLLTVKNADNSSRLSLRSHISCRRPSNLKNLVNDKTRDDAHATSTVRRHSLQQLSPSSAKSSAASPATSPSSGAAPTRGSAPISVPIPKKATEGGWKQQVREKVKAAKNKVSDRARRWGASGASASNQPPHSPTSACSSTSSGLMNVLV